MFHHNADAAALGLFQAVKEQPGVYVFGCQRRSVDPGADRVLGSAVIDLPHAFLWWPGGSAGTFTPQVEVFGLESGVVSYMPNPRLDSLVSPELKARMRAAADSIVAGTLIAAPRPATMEAARPRIPNGHLALLGAQLTSLK